MILYTYTTFRAVFAPAAARDMAGWETWPVTSVLGPAGEPGMTLLLPTDLSPVQLTLTVNDSADDYVPGVDQFDWYVSQRTDDTTRQPFQVLSWNQAYPGNPNTKSGTIVLHLQATEYIDTSGPVIDEENFAAVYRDVTAYVRNRSDGNITYGSLLVTPENVE
jgi:hypothetical protein